jgi:hypothetical protein
MLLRKAHAIVLIVKGCFKAVKWQYFDNLSMTTKMVKWPYEIGKPSMKSMLTSSHCLFGIFKGCKSPIGLKVSYLFL